MSIAVAAFAVGGWIAANAATLAIIAVSMIYQQDQMDKMKRKKEEQEAAARAQADAAKGLQVPVSGEPASLNIVYGRNLTGGAVVYQNTNNGYTYASGGAFTDITSSGDDRFTGACGGSKHEYLFMQQAICFADIDAVENVLINERNIKGDYVDADNNIVGASTPGANFVEPLKGSVKVRVSTTGGVADPMMAANDSTRAYAKFTKTAYASCVFWLNRDDPQYNGVPSLQFVVRGKKVRVLTGSAGNRSFGTAVYSNNPVL